MKSVTIVMGGVCALLSLLVVLGSAPAAHAADLPGARLAAGWSWLAYHVTRRGEVPLHGRRLAGMGVAPDGFNEDFQRVRGSLRTPADGAREGRSNVKA